MEDRYICGNDVGVKGLYSQRKLSCGYYVEPQYSNPTTKNPKKGARIITDNICAICYSLDDIVSRDQIKRITM